MNKQPLITIEQKLVQIRQIIDSIFLYDYSQVESEIMQTYLENELDKAGQHILHVRLVLNQEINRK